MYEHATEDPSQASVRASWVGANANDSSGNDSDDNNRARTRRGATGKAKARPKIRQGAGGGRGAETKQVTTSQMCVQLAAGDSVTHGTAA